MGDPFRPAATRPGRAATPAQTRICALLAGVVLLAGAPGCARTRVAPPTAPFPPVSRWEQPLDAPLAWPLATDGTLVFALSSTGRLDALDPASGTAVWTRAGSRPGAVAARPDLVILAEADGVVWGIDARDGNAIWKTTTRVRGVQSVRLDANRVFVGGASGFAGLMVKTGELQFDLPATDVRDIDVAEDFLAALEQGELVARQRDTGVERFRLKSPEGEFGAPAVFRDGRIILGSGNRRVREVSSRGDFGWRFKVGARVKDRPMDYGDGERVGVVSFEGVFYELSAHGGDMRHRVLLSSRPFGAPELAGGRVIVPVYEDEIAVIDAPSARLIGRTRFGGGFLSSPLLLHGRLLAEVAGPRRLIGLQMQAAN